MAVTDREYSDLPEVRSSPDDLPEPYASPNEALEVAKGNEEKELARTREDDAPEALPESEARKSRGRRRRRWIWGVAIVLVILAIALGVGLGIGLHQSQTQTQDPDNPAQEGGPSSPQFLSTRGAFNGTGTASTNRVRLFPNGTLGPEEDPRNVLLCYQHYTGEIRFMHYAAPDTWAGGTTNEVIATDAKNGTSIDVMVNSPSDNVELYVFYIGKDNMAKQKYRARGSSGWLDSDLNNNHLSVLDAPDLALRVGRYVGPIAGVDLDETNVRQASCMKMFVGVDETIISEYDWCFGLPGHEWKFQQNWTNINGRATPAFLGWTLPSIVYVAFIDSENNAQLYWRDSNETAQTTATHPLFQWTHASGGTISGVDPAVGLSGLSIFGTLLGRSLNDSMVRNWNVQLDAEDSSVSPSWSYKPPDIMSDSVLTGGVDRVGDPEQALLFYQTTGDDITMSTRNLTTGAWETVVWPIPDD